MTDRERSARELEIIERVRSICAPLPNVAIEVDGHGHTAFRIAKKPFILIGAGNGQGSLVFKADPTTQSMLVKRGPYVSSPGLGQHGWVALWGEEKFDWDELRDLLTDSFRLVAPKKLLAGLKLNGS